MRVTATPPPAPPEWPSEGTAILVLVALFLLIAILCAVGL